VWLASAASAPRASLDVWLGWLTPEERIAHGRFATESLRREWLVTRALSRWSLSRWIYGVDPAAWRFERTSAGRPFVVDPCEAPDFNLTNADGLVACAVSTARVGVDVEPVARGEELLENAERLFSERENADLRALPAHRRARRAVELWTLKEAWLKAIGDGIAVRLSRFSLVPESEKDGAERSRFRACEAVLGEDPAGWQLEVTPVDANGSAEGYVLAVAVRRDRDAFVDVRTSEGLDGAAPLGVTGMSRG